MLAGWTLAVAMMAVLAPQAVPVPPAAPPVSPPAAPLPEPGPDAMAIADRLLPPSDLIDWQARLQAELLRTVLAWRGVGCDETDSRCVTAAAKVAARNAPLAAAADRESRQWYMAVILQDRMTPADLKVAAAYMATPGGTSLADGLRGILDPGAVSPSLYRSMLATVAGRKAWTITPAAEEFFEATRDLPRSQRRMAPPVPPPQYSAPAPPPK
jgi:hypothetical protein